MKLEKGKVKVHTVIKRTENGFREKCKTYISHYKNNVTLFKSYRLIVSDRQLATGERIVKEFKGVRLAMMVFALKDETLEYAHGFVQYLKRMGK